MKNNSELFICIALLAATTSASGAESINLKTQTGNVYGLSFSTYKYQEPGLMTLKGNKVGLDFTSTKAFESSFFIRGDLRYANGTVNYRSDRSGNSSGQPDWYLEARTLFGKDWATNDTVYSTYTGLGYRSLSNYGDGVSSTGNWGYRRYSNYFYWPLGVIHRNALTDHARLVTTLEYDHLLSGTQVSSLSDGGQGYDNVKNTQNSGFGFKLSVLVETDRWAIGPFANYWNIGVSNSATLFQNGAPVNTWSEPGNRTKEFGLMVSRRF